MGVKIKDMPLEARPREKALFYGVESLSNEELLAIIISSGCQGESALSISKTMMKENVTLSSLAKLSTKEMMNYRGVKEATAIKLSVAFLLAKRLNEEAFLKSNSGPVDEGEIVKKYALEMATFDEEKVILLLLNKKKKIIKEKVVALGNHQNVSVQFNTILKQLLSTSCSYFYLLHNHPEGRYNASDEDIIFTHHIKDLAKRYKISLIDHLIFSSEGCYSMGKDSYI